LIFVVLTVTFYASFVPRVSGVGKVDADADITGKGKGRSQPIDLLVYPYAIAGRFSNEESVIVIV
jgi:hypothetical protein